MGKNNKCFDLSHCFVLLSPIFEPYEGEEHMLSVNYTELIPHLINKCKQQDKRINELESKIDMLIERLK